MSTSRDGPNPLRPYYKPPSIGIPHDPPNTTSSGTHGLGPRNGSAASYASSARDMFSDMDYSDYLSDTSPSALESVRKQVDDWFYKYMSILLAQPFDVAKTILQVRSQVLEDGLGPVAEDVRARRPSYRDSVYDDYPSDESDPDEVAYFTSVAPSATSYSPSRSRRRHSSDSRYSPPPKRPTTPRHQLILKRPDSILEVVSQEWNKEGAWGVWKGSNATFVYNILLQTIEKWSRGLLSALLNIPDSGLNVGLDTSADLVGPYPWASLGLAIGAAAMAGIILAPLDLLRTKLIITPTSLPKRSLTAQLRTLQSYLCPTSLIAPTILHSLVSPTISHSTPLLLRSHLGIDPVLTPNSYQLANFMSKSAELFLKLPLETVLRRAQVAALKEEVELARLQGEWQGDLDMTIKHGEYRGVIGTMWMIVREEGVRETPVATAAAKKVRGKQAPKQQKGQGLSGLWRGWRVGMWGLVGMWSARALNGANTGNAGEF
ncbi:related to chromosome segregation protein Cse1p [Phialocephala subalpina]|uniref:Related to chromosome segregation protein Cse1p n=1 Tax=Phialocephala subalpina TaxID=576137 RepID=A0A1L7WUP6_9HELO|nr:related to chromosome segregation protein Cse1p [Phialocephala subalpina]